MHPLLGNWQLIEAYGFDEAGQAMPSPFGSQPIGMAHPVRTGSRTRCVKSRSKGDRMVVMPLSRVLDRSSGLELTWKRIG